MACAQSLVPAALIAPRTPLPCIAAADAAVMKAHYLGGAGIAAANDFAAVPEGHFLAADGRAAPCARGEFKAGRGREDACQPCAAGVTTPGEASTSEAACTTLLPGYAPVKLSAGTVTAARLCPRGFFCTGGVPTAAFDPAAPAALAGTTVAACASGTTTADVGAFAALQCRESLRPAGRAAAREGGRDAGARS